MRTRLPRANRLLDGALLATWLASMLPVQAALFGPGSVKKDRTAGVEMSREIEEQIAVEESYRPAE